MILNKCFKARGFILVATALASFGFISHAGAQQRSYLVDLNSEAATQLGSLGGGETVAQALNNSGQVVGSSTTSEGVSHAFSTGPAAAGMKDLGTLGGGSSTANDINDAGQVVGKATTAEGQEHAFFTDSNSLGMRDLGTLGGHRSEATAIDNAGKVVGLYNKYLSLPEAPYEYTAGFTHRSKWNEHPVSWGSSTARHQ